MSVIFLFIDGIGVGTNKDSNPFHLNNYESFEFLSDKQYSNSGTTFKSAAQLYKPIDANLDVKGLPQSGTGQTTLFSGINASKVIGKHFGPYPHSGIKYLLKEHSIFHDVQALGKKAYFMNAYPQIFFDHAQKRDRWSCTTLMSRNAGIPLNSTNEVLNEEALTAEIIQEAWKERLGINIPSINAKEAANRLLKMAKIHDLVLFEYYLTDKAGHRQNEKDAHQVLKTLDTFLLELIENKESSDTIIITSDHGNLEDLTTKTHTRNPVPLFVLGNNIDRYSKVTSLIDVKEAVLDDLKGQ